MSRRSICRTTIPDLAAIFGDQSHLQPEITREIRSRSGQVRPTPGAGPLGAKREFSTRCVQLEANRVAVLDARTRAKAIQPTQGGIPSMDITGDALIDYVEAV